MHRSYLLMSAVAAVTFCSTPASAETSVSVVSRGKRIEISALRVSEQVTLFVYYKPASTLEADFIAKLKKGAGPKVAIQLIELATGLEPVAKQYEIVRTPTAIVMDRRGRIAGRSSDADAIRGFMSAAATVMRIDWAEAGTPLGDAADAASGGKGLKPGIMRTMSLQPDWLADFYSMTRKSHFSDTALTRRYKEMIATYVSGLNKCKF